MLQLGVSKTDITPAAPVPLAGFAHRTGNFDSVAAPLYLRCFWMENVLLVTADLIWWGPALTKSIQAQFPGVTVILHASHTHSGPQTAVEFAAELGIPSPEYLQALEAAVISGAALARTNIEPVQIHTGTVNLDLGIHRRKLVDGQIQMAPNPDGPTDPECTVIQFLTADGHEKALLIHATCHPTTTDARAISSEYCGHAMALLEAERGSVAGFLQGFCGDIRPALIKDGVFYRGTQADVEHLGSRLASAVPSAPLSLREPAPLLAQTISVPIPFEDPAHPPVHAELTALRLAQGLSLVTCNAEMVVAYGLFAKQQGLLPVGYTNGMIGYVTTARQLEEGGYESRGAYPYFGMPGPFSAATEALLRTAISNLAYSFSPT